MSQLKTIEFIKQNENWREILSLPPYSLNISFDNFQDRNLVILKYNQIESDFSKDIVKECRGLILDLTENVDAFSVPYFKFFNYGEPYADEIDWDSSHIYEKIDGSIIKIVKYNNELLISTNGVINAYNCNITNQIGCKFKNFGELTEEAIRLTALKQNISENYMEWFKSLLNENHTYMFELCSPYTRIVIPHTEIKLYFHGWRDNISLQEYDITESLIANFFPVPKMYPFNDAITCLVEASKLPWDDEGFVACDRNYKRVKIKSQEYLKIHKLANNGSLSIKRAIDLYMEGDYDELLAYFPEYKTTFDEIDKRYKEKLIELENIWESFNSLNLQSRKEQAIWLKNNTKHSGIFFGILNKGGTIKEKIREMYEKRKDSLIEMLNFHC